MPENSFESNTVITSQMIFESLDFLYVPAPDIESSIYYYTEVLGGRLIWKIHAFGVWVACIKLSENNEKPHVLLADHISKKDVKKIEIPPGPCCVFRDPADNALVIYENIRPDVMREFTGRIDNNNDDVDSATSEKK